ncbi:hypothetical protein [Castellaniella sp.]|nr:hypothetical protein [Castellaniella sp.]
MSFLLIWVIIGALIMLAYIIFFVDIDSHWADGFVGYPLVYLFTIFLWPITVFCLLWSQLAATRNARRR